jgi:hypothetical protein
VAQARHRGWQRSHAKCRTVHVRTRLSNGNVVVKTRHSCWANRIWSFKLWTGSGRKYAPGPERIDARYFASRKASFSPSGGSI